MAKIMARVSSPESPTAGAHGRPPQIATIARTRTWTTFLVQAHHDDDNLSLDELRVRARLRIFGDTDTTRTQPAHAAMHSCAAVPIQRATPTATCARRGTREEICASNRRSRGSSARPARTSSSRACSSRGLLQLSSAWLETEPLLFGELSFAITADRARHHDRGDRLRHRIDQLIAGSDMSGTLPLLAQRQGDIRSAGKKRWLMPIENTDAMAMPLAFMPRPRGALLPSTTADPTPNII
jgi:hypothetical protein